MSNLIKSSNVMTLDELKKLRSNADFLQKNVVEVEEKEEEPQVPTLDELTIKLKEQVLSDAAKTAETRLQEASIECEKMLQDAQSQIEVWWLEKRNEDEEIRLAAKEEGFAQGYEIGKETALNDVQKEWESRLNEAASVLRNAYSTREQIIQDAEPFIVELSCSIAEKLVGQQLSLEPQLIIDLISKTLARRREQGEITLCVAPSSLEFVQAAREELNAAIDSQAELLILPDASVKDNGCVIRSMYGSIDARIDTQLDEIKKELLLIAHQSIEERGQSNEHQA